MANIVRRIIGSPPAPKPGGPYSPAVIVDKTMYISGLIGINPSTNQLVPGGARAETEQILKNVQAILNAAGGSVNNIVKTTVLLTDINDFGAMNEAYSKFFADCKAARTTYQVAAIPNKTAKVEIETVAVLGDITDA